MEETKTNVVELGMGKKPAINRQLKSFDTVTSWGKGGAPAETHTYTLTRDQYLI